MRNAKRMLATAVIAGVASLALVSGCVSKQVRYVDSGRSYDATAALDVLQATDASAMMKQAASNGPTLRTRALAELTRDGSSASAAASLLTKTFPSDSGGVPVYVERVVFSGTPSVLVVEAAGHEGGRLSYKRLWVIGNDGEILFAGSR